MYINLDECKTTGYREKKAYQQLKQNVTTSWKHCKEGTLFSIMTITNYRLT